MEHTAPAALLSLVLTGLVVTASPGPATLGVLATGAAFGMRRSLPYVLGSVAGTTAVLVVVATGLTAAVLAHPVLGSGLLVLAVGYLAHLAWRIATAPPLPSAPEHAAPDVVRPPSWASGAVLACTNPKAWAGLATVIAGTGTQATGAGPTAVPTGVQVVVVAALVVVAHGAWLLVGSAFAAALRRPRVSRAVNVAMAVALVVSAVPALLALAA